MAGSVESRKPANNVLQDKRPRNLNERTEPIHNFWDKICIPLRMMLETDAVPSKMLTRQLLQPDTIPTKTRDQTLDRSVKGKIYKVYQC